MSYIMTVLNNDIYAEIVENRRVKVKVVDNKNKSQKALYAMIMSNYNVNLTKTDFDTLKTNDMLNDVKNNAYTIVEEVMLQCQCK